MLYELCMSACVLKMPRLKTVTLHPLQMLMAFPRPESNNYGVAKAVINGRFPADAFKRTGLAFARGLPHQLLGACFSTNCTRPLSTPNESRDAACHETSLSVPRIFTACVSRSDTARCAFGFRVEEGLICWFHRRRSGPNVLYYVSIARVLWIGWEMASCSLQTSA